MTTVPDAPSADWAGERVDPGEHKAVSLRVSASYSGADVEIPIIIWRGLRAGPTVSLTAAVHGDEINGTGAIRQIIVDRPFELTAGTLVLVPVVNVIGFERHSRYLPDRRDLNRSFPGYVTGSLTGRFARSFFDQVMSRCDYCIDLHTAAVRRTNFPNVRADLTDPALAEFARAFGAELIVSGQGPRGSLRRAACKAGCKTIILEAGEVWKVEPSVVEYAIRGITNCLMFLGMIAGKPSEPAYRIETDSTKWVRADFGGFLRFHVAPGDIIQKDDPIATNTSLTGDSQNVLRAPREGVVLGMTTLPAVAPGDPVCHLAFPKKGQLRTAEYSTAQLDDASLHERVRDALAAGIDVVDPSQEVS